MLVGHAMYVLCVHRLEAVTGDSHKSFVADDGGFLCCVASSIFANSKACESG